MTRGTAALIATIALALAGCAGRKAAATQPSPKMFDAAASDPKAIALADEILAACGGAASWAKAKEIRWYQAVAQDGVLHDLVAHKYDRWNGRHNYSRVEPAGVANQVMYDVYERTGVGYDGGGNQLTRDEAKRLMGEATIRLFIDSYLLLLPYKLKDPGVKLVYKGERAKEGEPTPTWDILRVEFDPAVGKDVYELAVNKNTHLIDTVEKAITKDGKEAFIGYGIDGWFEAGGLKFPTRFTNLGFPGETAKQVEVPEKWKEIAPFPPTVVRVPGETVFYYMITVHDTPDDTLYIPKVH